MNNDPIHDNETPTRLTPAECAHQPTPIPLQAQTLADDARHLTDEVSALREAATALTRRTHRNEWGVRLTIIGLILDVILSVFAFILLQKQSEQNTRIETSIQEQCSLYGLIIPSYSDAGRERSPLGPKAYDDAYRRIQTSADHLNCGIPHRI